MVIHKHSHFVKSEFGRYRDFFEKNITGFSYLFFAQTSFVAENIFWRYNLKGSFGKIPNPSLIGSFAIYAILASFLLPFIFVVGACSTFHYPKDKGERTSFIILILTLCLLIFGTTLMN